MTAVNGAPTTIAGLPSISSSLTGNEYIPLDLTLGGPTQKATLDEIADYVNNVSGVPATRTINTIDSLSGGGTLAADLTLTLVNDVGSPGAYAYYGTDPTGIRGWQLNTTLPANAVFLQTYAISSTAPSNGDVLVWVAGDNQWEPQASVPGGGTVTSISASTGIVCTPDPIVATGTVAVDTTVVARYTVDTQWSKRVCGRAPVALTDAAPTAWDMSAGNFFTWTLTADHQLQNPTNKLNGDSGYLFIKEDGSGGHTPTFDTDYVLVGGTPTWVTTASAVNFLNYAVEGGVVYLFFGGTT